MKKELYIILSSALIATPLIWGMDRPAYNAEAVLAHGLINFLCPSEGGAQTLLIAFYEGERDLDSNCPQVQQLVQAMKDTWDENKALYNTPSDPQN